jgi:hypothetical protein
MRRAQRLPVADTTSTHHRCSIDIDFFEDFSPQQEFRLDLSLPKAEGAGRLKAPDWALSYGAEQRHDLGVIERHYGVEKT